MCPFGYISCTARHLRLHHADNEDTSLSPRADLPAATLWTMLARKGCLQPSRHCPHALSACPLCRGTQLQRRLVNLLWVSRQSQRFCHQKFYCFLCLKPVLLMQGGLAADQRDHSAQDIGVIASGAAYSQGIAEQADWLGSAKITMQVCNVTFEGTDQVPHYILSWS